VLLELCERSRAKQVDGGAHTSREVLCVCWIGGRCGLVTDLPATERSVRRVASD